MADAKIFGGKMAISIRNLSHIYMKGMPFEKRALDNINLNIEDGELVGIIGHTGSGKSTLVQHLNGLLKPSEGQVIINGNEITGKNITEIRKEVGLVFQYPEHQLFEETVYKDIAFGLYKRNVDSEEIDKRVKEVATLLEIEDVLLKSPFELSGGQKRRVAIGGVLVLEPRILVLDEPAAGLDPKGRDDIFNIIRELHQKSGITIMIVSHSMEDIAILAKRVIVMNNGKIDMDGEPGEIFKNVQRLEEIGLAAPEITYFMKKLKKLIPQIDDGIYTIEEAKEEIKRHLPLKNRKGF